MKKILLSISLSTYLFSAGVVVPDDYLISDDKELSYIYSAEHVSIMPELKAYQEEIIKGYEQEYGFKLDDKLHVGLASNNNQIANGFSTQFPFNAQLFYGAGATYIDYFSFSSWLKTLIIHETAHNFQLNPKENELSRISHNVLGNSPFSMLLFLPLFPVPNITESSFILEGNGVVNESRYGNGGRLFSGYALAEVIALAQAGEITPELMYNQTFRFPYGEKFYLVGGFFQQFLVEKYGIEAVNGYFKKYAQQSFPFFTNAVFKKQYGKDFETLLAEFVNEVKSRHKGFKSTQGTLIAKSQMFTPLNVDKDEVYTLVSDRKSASKVLKIDKKSKTFSYKNGSWLGGELFKYNGEYYTQSASKVSPTKIKMGLFDKDGYLLDKTSSKVIQGYMANGKVVYFDVKTSIETPQVYVDGVFYTQSHSSVYVHKNDLYYFKQEGEKRVLYKHKKALFNYQGHYGFVTDVDEVGNIYFIAPSEHGTSVYCLERGSVKRVLESDDVIDFKLLKSKEAIVATVGAEGYTYQTISFDTRRVGFGRPHEFKIEQSGRLKPTLQLSNFSEVQSGLKLPSVDYVPLKELHYSSLEQSMGYGSYEGFILNLQANFSDPLMQNSLSALLSHDNKRTVGGLQYNNVAHQLEFGGAVYGVIKDEVLTDEYQDYGVNAYLKLPFLAKGYWRGSSSLSYTKAYDDKNREPLTLSLDFFNHKQFGFSKYPNSLNALSLFATKDRENTILGGFYEWSHDMPWQSYIGLKGAHLKSDIVNPLTETGIKLHDGLGDLQSDKATLDVPTFSSTGYAKEVKMAEVSFKKVFDGSLYNFSLPLSLQRESVYFKQRFYDIDFTDKVNKKYNESIIGVEADLLFFHKLSMPISLEYLYNPDVKEKEQFRVLFGGSF